MFIRVIEQLTVESGIYVLLCIISMIINQ